jgi:type IV pilus assembly protein PilF
MSMGRRAIRTVLILLVVALAACASSSERQADRDKRHQRSQTHVLLGASYLQRGQLDVAEQELNKALSEEPDNSQANNIMAVLQWRLKYYDKAERLFRKALNEDSKNSSAYHNYGAFLCEQGKLDEGIRNFEMAAKDPLYPYTADVYLNMGVCLMKKPAPVAAEKYFREALSVNPKLAAALYQMAKLSFDSGRTLSARGFMQRYYEVAGDTPAGLLLAVKIEHALGHKNAEASYALLLRNKFPDSPEAGQLQAATSRRKK